MGCEAWVRELWFKSQSWVMVVWCAPTPPRVLVGSLCLLPSFPHAKPLNSQGYGKKSDYLALRNALFLFSRPVVLFPPRAQGVLLIYIVLFLLSTGVH